MSLEIQSTPPSPSTTTGGMTPGIVKVYQWTSETGLEYLFESDRDKPVQIYVNDLLEGYKDDIDYIIDVVYDYGIVIDKILSVSVVGNKLIVEFLDENRVYDILHVIIDVSEVTEINDISGAMEDIDEIKDKIIKIYDVDVYIFIVGKRRYTDDIFNALLIITSP